MWTDNNTERLQAIFRVVLQVGPERDVQALRQHEIERWDSMAQVMLVSAMESEFGIRIDIADSLRIDSFRAAQALLTDKIT